MVFGRKLSQVDALLFQRGEIPYRFSKRHSGERGLTNIKMAITQRTSVMLINALTLLRRDLSLRTMPSIMVTGL